MPAGPCGDQWMQLTQAHRMKWSLFGGTTAKLTIPKRVWLVLPGTHSLPVRVDAVKAFSCLCTTKLLQEFRGIEIFSNPFYPQAVQLMQPLYEALYGNQAMHWSPGKLKAFRAAEDALVQVTLLVHPFTDAPSALKMVSYVVSAVRDR